MTPYRRKLFIKDLFSTRGLLNLFDAVQFSSVLDFMDALNKKWLEIDRNQRIIIRLQDYGLGALEELFVSTAILQTNRVAIDISELTDLHDVAPFLDISDPLEVYVNMDRFADVRELQELLDTSIREEWFSKNRLVIDCYLDKFNFKNNLNALVEIYMRTGVRFFRLHLDYESLSELTFIEFEDLKFRLADLLNWSWQTKEKQGIAFNFAPNTKSVILSAGKLFINSYAVRDSSPILDLNDKDDVTGEDIQSRELIAFRSYLELKEYEVAAFSELSPLRKALIDPYFNKKMTSSYVTLPPITKLMLTIFN